MFIKKFMKRLNGFVKLRAVSKLPTFFLYTLWSRIAGIGAPNT
jgi:hypothetical protein